MAHCISEGAEEILDKKFEVLDKGFVRLVDYLGSDERIVAAARVSYGAGTKSYREDKGLIDYLLRNEHTSPFEQVVLTFHLKMPLFVARQWVRHRTARMNEISGRYSVMSEEFFVPDEGELALQSKDNKQGRAEELLPPEKRLEILSQMKSDQTKLYENYHTMLDVGLAREMARINLPISLYTEFYWQIDLHNLFHFIKLRTHPHAQKEIRGYAEKLLFAASKVAPLATASFQNHRQNSVTFSCDELAELRRMSEGRDCALEGKVKERFLAKLIDGRQG